jgi:very-short-patch-repair endonuclease
VIAEPVLGLDPRDNARRESLFATLECERIDRRRFRSQAEARLAVFQFIEGWYYERKGIQGICICLDGPQHDQPAQAERDRQTPEALQDLGFRVVVIGHGRTLTDRIDENQDIFRAAWLRSTNEAKAGTPATRSGHRATCP